MAQNKVYFSVRVHTHKSIHSVRMDSRAAEYNNSYVRSEPSPAATQLQSTLSVCSSGVYAVTWTPSREQERQRSSQLWDAMNQKQLWSGPCTDQNYNLSYSPVTNKIFDKNVLSRIFVWDIALGTTTSIGRAERYHFCRCNNNGTRLLTQLVAPNNSTLESSDEFIISILDIDDGSELFSQTTPVKYGAYFTADDTKIVACSTDCRVCIFDSETGDSILNFVAMNNKEEILGVGTKTSRCFTHYKQRLGVWDCDTGIRIFRANTDGNIRTACFGKNDDLIIAASVNPIRGNPNELCCWNLTDRCILYKMEASMAEIWNIVLSPITAGFVVMYNERIIQEYDGIYGTPTTGLISFKGRICHLVASNCGNILL
jgi:WD40 repeat protein